MKKFLSFSLALLLIISCTLLHSCKKQTPYEIVSEAIENTQSFSSFKAEINSGGEVSVLGVKVDLSIERELYVSGIDTDSPICRSTMTTTALGETTTVGVYVKDGVYYIKTDDIETKISADKLDGTLFEDLKLDTKEIDLSYIIMPLPESLFTEDTVIFDNGDGTESVRLDLSAEEFKDLFSEFINIIIGIDINDVDDDNNVFAPATLKLTIDNKCISAVSISTEISGTMQGMEATLSVNACFKDINKNKKVSPIEGYEDFKEFSESLFG